MEQDALAKIAQQYRDEGYEVLLEPRGESAPSFAAGFHLDLIAIRGIEGVVVEVKTNRIGLSNDPYITRLAEIVIAQPGWRLDVVVLEPVTPAERAAQDASEPSELQLAQILSAAEEMADKGYAPYACVVAWGGLEAVMRRLRDQPEFQGRTTPAVLMQTLYGNGFLSRDQFERLRESYKVRSQVVHGLIPAKVDAAMVRDITAAARSLAQGEGAAVTIH